MLIFKLLPILIAVIGAQEAQEPLVTLDQGTLKGSWKISPKGRNYACFLGVPYAKPPVGKLRFRSPERLKSWAGIWDATKPLKHCLQYDPQIKDISGDENCLYMNIYTPKLDSKESMPVIVYIHGGAFMFNSGYFYDPSNLMDKDLVVVTFNSRLGPFGFLSTNDTIAPGNYGLKDQAFALQWVKDNIKKFGGDSASVTLMGYSSGGANVYFHFLSPLSEGLFVRGMAMSGSPLAPWALSSDPLSKAHELATLVGCPVDINKEMVDCLKRRPAEVIVNAHKEMIDERFFTWTPFKPVVEPANGYRPFITQEPYLAMNSSSMQKLPLLTSITSQDGVYSAADYLENPELLPELEENFVEIANSLFEFNHKLPLNETAVTRIAKIKKHYFGGEPISRDTFKELIQALGDHRYVLPVVKMAEIHAQHSGQPVHFYRYTFLGNMSYFNAWADPEFSSNISSASHGDDLAHILTNSNLTSDLPEDALISEMLINMVYSYASTGVPKLTDGQEWLPVTPGSKEINYLEISSPTEIQMKSSSDLGEKSFWDKLDFDEEDNNENNSSETKEEL